MVPLGKYLVVYQLTYCGNPIVPSFQRKYCGVLLLDNKICPSEDHVFLEWYNNINYLITVFPLPNRFKFRLILPFQPEVVKPSMIW